MAATQLQSGMAALDINAGEQASQTKRSFPFFRLPRELRNRIYRHLTLPQIIPVYAHPPGMDEDGTEEDGVDCYVLDQTPYLQMVQTSRQIKEEYEEEMAVVPVTLSANIRYLTEVESSCKRVEVAWLKNSLNKVDTLELQVGPGQFLWATSFMQYIPSLLRYLPAVKKLRVICCENIKEISLMIDDGRFKKEQFQDLTAANFRRLLLSRSNAESIPDMRSRLEQMQVEFDGIVLKDRLFDTPRPGGRLRTSNVNLHPKNRIVYHAKLSNSKYAWNGLELEVDEEETGSFEEIKANSGISRADIMMIWRCGYRTLNLDCLEEGALWKPEKEDVDVDEEDDEWEDIDE